MTMKTASPDTDRDAAPELRAEEARIWLARLSAGNVKQAELQAFLRWQRSTPAHAAAFEQVKRQWAAMRPALGELLRSEPEIAARLERLRSSSAGQRRRAFLGSALGATAVAGVAASAVIYPPFGLWPAPAEWGADFSTATGEQRTIALAPRVNVTLNTQTRVRRGNAPIGLDDESAAGIELLSGEAAIDLAGEGGAFAVGAGNGRTVARAGRFEVRHLNETVRVICLEGAVEVVHPAGRCALQARQQLVYDARSISGIAAVDPVDVSSWRRGELVFRRTPLAQVVEEINRYRPGRVLLTAQSRRQTPVSGRFTIGTLDEALLQIQHSFDLRARTFPGGLLVLS